MRTRYPCRACLLVGLLLGLICLGCASGESTKNHCDQVDCSGHGLCAVHLDAPVCLCDPGYQAHELECIPDPCSQLNCIHGNCELPAEDDLPICVCEPGYSGASCDSCQAGFHVEGLSCVPDNACESLECIHGICLIVGESATCDCDLGFDGTVCDRCAPGYHPDGLRCVRNSACDPDPCVHGTCVDLNGEAICSCREAYAGERCQVCAPGYEAVDLTCVAVSTESCQPNPCDTIHRTVCVEQLDGYVCECDFGYHDQLGVCVQDTFCSPNPCQQVHKTVCRLTEDFYVCECEPGYHDDAGNCIADTVCDPATTCAGHGACVGDGLECECDQGYVGDNCQQCDSGYHPLDGSCVPNSFCEPNPCVQIARTVCVELADGYSCSCDEGYQDQDGDGTCLLDCANASLNCQNNSHCEIQLGQAECICDIGYQDNDGDGVCSATCSTSGLQCPDGYVCSHSSGQAECVSGTHPPIYISFLWHMHQPIYWPYESVVDSESNSRMPFSLYSVHFDRTGPYTTWPRDAVDAGRGLPHLGAQVSFSGSLMENLSALEEAGVGFFGWTEPWREAHAWLTTEGNPRLDIVNFGYHHPLMGLIDTDDIRLQLKAHRQMAGTKFGGMVSKGIFPPECAFSQRMIPGLVAEGIEWTLVDNVHFDRAHVDYPFRPESNLPAPNRADQVNTSDTDWIQLVDLWAPSPVAAPWGYRPHWVQYTDPETGQVSRMIAVPAARYEGNEDARGGFGALQYEQVLSQYEHLNTDPNHPMLVVLHHDGDNYGGGTESYYHGNFQSFVAWVGSQPERFVATTVQDYLDLFPPDPADVIHVEDGSWSGADNGDPEFLKWNGNPSADGYSPDRNSWAVLTAVKNRVMTAQAISGYTSEQAIIDGSGSDTDKAWHFLLNAETSCYWYWDNSADGIWDSHPTRAANQAAVFADTVIANGPDSIGPTIYLPQREPYNPGLDQESRDFVVWTFVDDVSGLDEVELFWRVDADGVRDAENELYSGGSWNESSMVSSSQPANTDPLPVYKADLYAAEIAGLADELVDYYVYASDSLGHQVRSPLMHVWVGSGGMATADLWEPENPSAQDSITIFWGQPASIHWGVDASLNGQWSPPAAEYWPAGSVLWSDGHAIESPLIGPDAQGRYTIQIGPFNGTTPVAEVNFVFHNDDQTWSSPDHTIVISQE